jgi:hypothetical protein
LGKALELAEDAIRVTDPKNLEVFTEKTFEARDFVLYLGCLRAIPVPESTNIASVEIVKWPLSFDFTVTYPLVFAVRINPKDASNGRPFIVVKQPASDSPWEMTEGRVESLKGEIAKNIPLPSAKTQQQANAGLPRILKEREANAANNTLPPTGCAGG